MLQKFLKYLKQSYPTSTEIRRKWIIILGVGLFVVIFVRFFGLADREGVDNIFIILGFGLITMLAMTINWIILPNLFRRFFQEDKWNVAKEIIFHIWNIHIIGLFNLLYANIGGYYPINLTTLIQAQITTLMVGIFPVTFIIMFKQNRLLKRYVEGARELNDTIQSDKYHPNQTDNQAQSISLFSESGKDPIQIDLSALRVIKSVDNYVEVYWASPKGIQKTLLRSSLKRMEDQLKSYASIFRCHRTYLIHVRYIDRITGNSQGYRVMMKGIEDSIPVARSYSRVFRELMIRPK